MYGEEGWDALRRGRRYSLHLPVRFRTTGETEWHVGTTENVSHSGVTIRASAAPPPSAPVDVEITLPSTGLDTNGCLLGHGRVVRISTPEVSATGPVFAVIVARFRLEPLRRGFDTLAR
jgi:hypothetical protein